MRLEATSNPAPTPASSAPNLGQAVFGESTPVAIRPFSDDVVIRGNRGIVRYYFEIPKLAAVPADPQFILSYQVSSLSQRPGAYLTVLVNGQPVETQLPRATGNKLSDWTTTIPRGMFKVGFNDLAVAIGSRSTVGPCQEEDDQGDWWRLKAKSQLNFTVQRPNRDELASYPFPYLNRLKQAPVAAPIVCALKASDATLAEALNLASGWGMRESAKPFVVGLRRAAIGTPIGQRSVRLGLTSDFGLPRPKSGIVAGDGDLFVTGASPEKLAASVQTLSESTLTDQFWGPTSDALPFRNAEHALRTRVGQATFGELGFSDISLAGIGTQSTTLVLHRPLGASLGRGAALHLRFRHAATLMPSKSLLSVKINNQALGSVALNQQNSNSGELVCNVPVDVVNDSEWVVNITAQNELANADCAKRYESSAWTQLLATSELTVQPGSLAFRPYLEGFPYLRDLDGKMPALVQIGLRKDASNEELSVAATLAARASQTNGAAPHWQVNPSVASDQMSVIVGLYTEEGRFGSISPSMLIKPSAKGDLVVSPKLPILPASLAGGVVVQAIPSPKGATYVVMGANKAVLGDFATFLGNPRNASAMKGEVAVMTRDGRFYTFSTVTKGDLIDAEAAEMRRYKPEMTMIMAAIVTFLIGCAFFIASKFVKRKSPKN